MNLFEIFNTIVSPKEDDEFQFSAIPIPKYENHRIAKDKEGKPALLISASNHLGNSVSTNFKLQNVSVLFETICSIELNGNLIEKKLTAICFIGKETSLQKYFLKLCSSFIEDLGATPTQEQIRKEIIHFIELLRLATEPQLKTVQGLWAELFLIAESKEPDRLIKCWHYLPEEKFDFNNGDERIEVKASSSGIRNHNFSIEQVNPPLGTRAMIASVFVKQAGAGKSIEDLQMEIKLKILRKVDLIEKLNLQIALLLGKSIADAIKIKFDWHLAKESFHFYRTEDIPKISVDNITPLVSEVRFKSDLSLTTPIPRSELRNMFFLFE